MITKKTNIKLKMMDTTTGKEFWKYFETEHDKQKFIRKLKYSKKIIIVYDEENYL